VCLIQILKIERRCESRDAVAIPAVAMAIFEESVLQKIGARVSQREVILTFIQALEPILAPSSLR
jgi:tRNA A37 threonylcarbamoyladenosine synthetase subunit TsaC/SUA5/YrdC